MWSFLLPVLLGLVIVGLAGAAYVQRTRLARHIEAINEELLGTAAAPVPPIARREDYADLPRPVQRYLTHVLPRDQPCVQAVRLHQTGAFRSGDAASPWNDFVATQHVTTRPPGFVWEASIRIMPGLSVRVVDAYVGGHGLLGAHLGGVVPVADPTPGPSLDEGELLRYLAESPLYPTALLPDQGVTWTAVTDQSARATLTHRNTTASLVFHFNARNEVERVTGKRPFATEAGTFELRPWKGYWRSYERQDGMCVPMEGEVAWIHPDGETSYWRGRVDTIDYQFAVPDAPIPHSFSASS